MARRFGGPHSPGGDPRAPASQRASASASRPDAAPGAVRTRQRNPVGARVHLLFVLPFAWALTAFFRDPAGLLLHLGVFALLILSAWLTREGVIAHAAYDERRIARRPAFPRKIFGSVAMGLGLTLAGVVGMGPVLAVAVGALGGVLHLMSFGPDPMRNKGMDGVDEFQTDRVARAVAEAERRLTDMTETIGRLNDRHLTDRLRDFAGQVRPLLRAVENDPRQLSGVRRYLGLYLDGAREATTKFADLYARNRDAGARADYMALLDDLQRNFALRLETLQTADRQALDIEMDVLRERLAREGVRPALPTTDTIDPFAEALSRPAPVAQKGQSDV
jgi:hypothetical protein